MQNKANANTGNDKRPGEDLVTKRSIVHCGQGNKKTTLPNPRSPPFVPTLFVTYIFFFVFTPSISSPETYGINLTNCSQVNGKCVYLWNTVLFVVTCLLITSIWQILVEVAPKWKCLWQQVLLRKSKGYNFSFRRSLLLFPVHVLRILLLIKVSLLKDPNVVTPRSLDEVNL